MCQCLDKMKTYRGIGMFRKWFAEKERKAPIAINRLSVYVVEKTIDIPVEYANLTIAELMGRGIIPPTVHVVGAKIEYEDGHVIHRDTYGMYHFDSTRKYGEK